MRKTNHKGGCWPDGHQELLLRAALLPGIDAIQAWQQWQSRLDIEYLDPGSYRLLPQLYHNLCAQGIKDPLMNKFKGVYRHTWYKNQLLFYRAASVLRAFHKASVETLILKGTALVLLHYKDHGLRPMEDFDLLVHTKQTLTAIELLGKLGWTPKWRTFESLTKEYIATTHGHGFIDDAGQRIDLHWHVLPEDCRANADDDFWKGAVTTKFHGVSTYALNPTDQLLHVCTHGAKWNRTPPLRWVADAKKIMSTSQSEIDWDRLVAQAGQHHLILPLIDTLNYLRDTLNAPIPPQVLQNLQKMPATKTEHIVYLIKQSPLTSTKLLKLWFRHVRSVESDTLWYHKLIGFPKFLQHFWAVNYLWQLPFYAVFKGLRRIWRTGLV